MRVIGCPDIDGDWSHIIGDDEYIKAAEWVEGEWRLLVCRYHSRPNPAPRYRLYGGYRPRVDPYKGPSPFAVNHPTHGYGSIDGRA